MVNFGFFKFSIFFIILSVFDRKSYYSITASIIPLDDNFDKGHGRDHARYVISQAMELSRHYDVDPEIVYPAAANGGA